MAGYGTSRPAPGLKTPFNQAVVFEAGKGNKAGVESSKGSGPGKQERGGK